MLAKKQEDANGQAQTVLVRLRHWLVVVVAVRKVVVSDILARVEHVAGSRRERGTIAGPVRLCVHS